MLPNEIFDNSTKLLLCQREQLKAWKERYDLSYAAVAENYSISKSTAYYICNPKAAEKKNQKWLRDHKKYLNKEKNVIAATKSRKKTVEIIKKYNLAS